MTELKKDEPDTEKKTDSEELKTGKESRETSESTDSKKLEHKKKRIRQRVKENSLFYVFAGLCVILLIAVVLLIKPAMLASKISKQFDELGMQPSEYLMQLEATKSDLVIAKNNAESCKNLNQEIVSDIATEKNATMFCNRQKTLLDSQIADMKRQNELNITAMNDVIDREKTRYNDLNRTYSAIIRNSASNMCCKAKVDDSAVDSYSVVNDKIICGTGEKINLTC